MLTMTNPFAHDPDCDFWFDHYEQECTCTRPGWKPLAADPARELRAVRDEIAELRRRVEELEAQVAVVTQQISLDGDKHTAQAWRARRKIG